MKKILILLGISILPLIPLLHSGLPLTHDGADHLARIASFYGALSEGVVFPRWGELLNWGYGHPILMFLYPFSSYSASLFHFIGFSYIDSLKIIFALGFVASGMGMYLWAKEQFNNEVGMLSAVLYLFAPYRSIDLYVRGAIGEHMAFIFPPFVLFFMLKFFKAGNNSVSYYYFLGLAISFSLLLLSHNAISLMFVPIFITYAFYLFYRMKSFKKLIVIFSAFFAGFLLSAFFTVPAFFEGKFTLRDIVTGNEYKNRFVESPLKFLYGNWNFGITGQFSVQLGFIHLLGIVAFPLVLYGKKIKKSTKVLLGMFGFFLIFSLFIQLSASNFLYETITTLKKFQFPWRFLSLSTFSSTVVASSMLFLFGKKERHKVLFIFIFLVLATSVNFWKTNGYFFKSDEFYEEIYRGTTDTGESAPIWSVRFMEKKPNDYAEVIGGKAVIQILDRTSTKHSYLINVISENARIRENTLYFPGWKVLVDGNNTEIQFQDPSERGLITYYLPKGTHSVEIVFEDTKLRTISNITSLATFMFLLVGLIVLIVRRIKII